jgi:hypothetical protein
MSLHDEYVGRWGILGGGGVFVIRPDLYHPDDAKILSLHQQKVFYCQGVTEEDYLILTYGEMSIRVKPVLFLTLYKPLDFYLGDEVIVKDYPERLAKVYYVGWHYKRNEPMFYLWVDGKKKSRRYFKEDLQKKQL